MLGVCGGWNLAAEGADGPLDWRAARDEGEGRRGRLVRRDARGVDDAEDHMHDHHGEAGSKCRLGLG